METWNRLITVGGEEGQGEWWKEREETSQRICMKVVWTWTTQRKLTVGQKGGLGEGRQRGEKVGL